MADISAEAYYCTPHKRIDGVTPPGDKRSPRYYFLKRSCRAFMASLDWVVVVGVATVAVPPLRSLTLIVRALNKAQSLAELFLVTLFKIDSAHSKRAEGSNE